MALDNSSYFKDHGSVDGTYTSERQSAVNPDTLGEDRAQQGPPNYRQLYARDVAV